MGIAQTPEAESLLREMVIHFGDHWNVQSLLYEVVPQPHGVRLSNLPGWVELGEMGHPALSDNPSERLEFLVSALEKLPGYIQNPMNTATIGFLFVAEAYAVDGGEMSVDVGNRVLEEIRNERNPLSVPGVHEIRIMTFVGNDRSSAILYHRRDTGEVSISDGAGWSGGVLDHLKRLVGVLDRAIATQN